MDLKAHKDLLRQQFASQARVHGRTIQFRRTENVAPMIDLAKPQASDRLIDVATGWRGGCSSAPARRRSARSSA